MGESSPQPRWWARGLPVRVLLLAAAFCAGVGYGVVATRAGRFPVAVLERLWQGARSLGAGQQDAPAGRWRRIDGRGSALTEEQAREIERLTALGYVSGSRPSQERPRETARAPSRWLGSRTLECGRRRAPASKMKGP